MTPLVLDHRLVTHLADRWPLRGLPVVHRDLKPENTLMRSTDDALHCEALHGDR